MERKSARIQQQGKPSGRSKKRANKKEKIVISDSDSEKTQSLHEDSPPAKKMRTEKGDEGSSVDPQKETETQGSDQPKSDKKKGGEKKKSGEADKGKSAQESKKKQAAEEQEKDKPSEKKSRVKQAATATKKGYQGKDVLPSEWFISSEVRSVWMQGYASSKVAFCSMVSEELLDKLDIDLVRKLRETAIWKLLNPSSKAYPRLTRLFFLNLVQEDDEKMVLTSKVAGVDLRLDHRAFAKVLGIPRKYKVDDYPDRKECLEKAKEMFFLEGVPSGPKQLTHSVLNCEAKILFTILMRSVVPRENSRELVTDKVLILMYLISQGFEIDLPTIVMEHMVYCATRTRNHPLPYANLLPLFFEYFDVPVKGEEKIAGGFGLIDETALQRIGVVQTGKGHWKFYSELSKAELAEKEFVKPKGVTSGKGQANEDYSLLVEKLEEQQVEVEDLRQRLFDLSTEFHQFKGLMNGMNGKLDMIIKGLNLEKVPSATSHDTSVDTEERLGDFLKKKKKKPIPVVLTSKDLYEQSDEENAEEGTGVDAATEGDSVQAQKKKADEIIAEVVKEVEAEQEGHESDDGDTDNDKEVGDGSEEESEKGSEKE